LNSNERRGRRGAPINRGSQRLGIGVRIASSIEHDANNISELNYQVHEFPAGYGLKK